MNLFQEIKLLFALKNVVQSEAKEIKTMDIKTGWKTTEFWGKVATQAAAIWSAVGGFIPPKYAAIVVVVAEGIYTIARTGLKMVQAVQSAKADQPASPVTVSTGSTTTVVSAQ